MLRTDFEGRGLMTEAAHGLLSHAFGAGGLHRIAAFADVENVGSQQVLARLGFRHEGTVRHMPATRSAAGATIMPTGCWKGNCVADDSEPGSAGLRGDGNGTGGIRRAVRRRMAFSPASASPRRWRRRWQSPGGSGPRAS